jgi:SIR2-like domain
MRFSRDGPDIPNALVSRWRDGRVVFLAGAGISMPSPTCLPNFRGLVLRVYERLNDPLYAVLSKAVQASSDEERNRTLQTSLLSAPQRVEAGLFFASEYDRLFSALERRIDQDARGRMTSRRVRNCVEHILRAHGGHGQGHRDLVRLSAAPRSVADLTTAGPTCRIITTNFDLLLEDAWRAEFNNDTLSYDARMAPRPGSHDFEGIVHVHVLLHRDDSQPASLVLSSRDFARVYLRSGVVANYIYDLVRRYSIVLVGYSAEDETMRYLMDAIGEDVALFDDMNQPYAISARIRGEHDATSEISAQTWWAKNIQPIPYDENPDSDDKHAGLWLSIHEWAEWARRDMDWTREKLAEATALPHDEADGFAKNLVQDLFAVWDYRDQSMAVEFLRHRSVDFNWITAIDRAFASGSEISS